MTLLINLISKKIYVIKILMLSASGIFGSNVIFVNLVVFKTFTENNKIYILNNIQYVNNKIEY